MLQVQVSNASPDSGRPSTLADLSRNTSVISSSSSSSSTSSLVVKTPRPRPIRTFSSPRSLSRDAPPTPRASRPPAYLAKELGLLNGDGSNSYTDLKKRAQSRSKSRTKSRNSSVGLRLQASDFEFGEILGEGSYSTVMHAIYPPTEEEYAIKVLDKGHLKRNNKLQIALTEKNVLVRLGSGHPGVVRLHWAFHDEWSLYFVLDLARNGDLQSRMTRLGSLSLPCSRYYAAQIVDAVAYIHSKGVIHRDLKPENLLLDDNMRIKITDFGTGKILEDGERAGTFVGTAQYVSPELLTTNTTSKSSDIWAIGCIIFQMISGRFPFHALSEYLTWQKVKNLEYEFPEGFDETAKDLVQKLLVLDPSQRLGAGEPGSLNDYNTFRSHPFFAGIDWSTLWMDPAPPLEAGLVKKDPPPPTGSDYDLDVTWDGFGNSVEDDGISWAEHEGDVEAMPAYPYHHHYDRGEEIGPLDVVTPLNGAPHNVRYVNEVEQQRGRLGLGGLAHQGVVEVVSTAQQTQHNTETNGLKPIDIPLRGSVSAGSATSSSEGSPVERLGAALDAMAIDRGRDRAKTPIQLTESPDAQWMSLLRPGEALIFHSSVDCRSRSRRLTATLLPIPVSQSKPKIRHLILSTRRLLCVKVKSGRMTTKCEALVNASSREKEDKKDNRPIITDVCAKGVKSFVVLTSGKSQLYSTPEQPLTERWISEIKQCLNAVAQSSNKTRSGSPSTRIQNKLS